MPQGQRHSARWIVLLALAAGAAATALPLSAAASGTSEAAMLRRCKRHPGACHCPVQTPHRLAPSGVSAPQTSWAPVGSLPLSDAKAAAMVRHRPEQRPQNTHYNDFVPSAAEIAAFHSARTSSGESILRSNRLNAYVDGTSCMSKPSTDDLIQWASVKWGIPTDWLRAEYVHESYWDQQNTGDRAVVPVQWYREYPLIAQIPGSREREVFESLGIAQIKWKPDNSQWAGTEPLRWKSTAFNVDYQAATVRFYYDDPMGLRTAWGDSSYAPGNQWLSIGGWFEPYPWNNAGQSTYIMNVQQNLAARTWAQPGF
jgi:hypothetical protein